MSAGDEPRAHVRDVRTCVFTPPYAFSSPHAGEPFALLLVICDPAVEATERQEFCNQLVRSGCRYVLCAGLDTETWHDSVDDAYMATDPDFNPPLETHIMTTWHDDEPLADVVDFMFDHAICDGSMLKRHLIAFVGDDPLARIECESQVKRRASPPPA